MKPTGKTNAMRMLDREGIAYRTASYEVDESDLSGVHAAELLGVPASYLYKTLVTKGERTGYQVFVIPADRELDLKKAAAAAGDKRVEMVAVKELLPLTGYVRGGCSPLGMKKRFPTHFDESAASLPEIYVSAGQRGLQMIVEPHALARAIGGDFKPLL